MGGFRSDQARGPDGKWIKEKIGGTVVGAALVATVMATPIGAGVTASGGALSAESSIGQLARGTLDKAKQSAKKGQRRTTWKRLDLREVTRKSDRVADCAVHSYGRVQRFLATTPCRSLHRVLYALDGRDGDRVVVSVSWVRMRSTGAARALRNLVDVHGTGNVRPLPGWLVGAGRIDWTGWNYDSVRSGRQVTIAEVEPLRGSPSAEYMDAVAEAAAQFPRPR